MTGRYTFGDGDLAARRLAMVASIFDPVSAPFLAASVPSGVDLALDLGCGPGYTTRLLASTCGPRRTVGLERSAHFVGVARGLHGSPGLVDFDVADVTALPLTGAPADVIHARLLLAHLPDPLRLVAQWRTQLRPGGVLVLDEIESMTPPPGPLRRYEELVVALVAAEGGVMDAGPLLAGLGGTCPSVDVLGHRRPHVRHEPGHLADRSRLAGTGVHRGAGPAGGRPGGDRRLTARRCGPLGAAPDRRARRGLTWAGARRTGHGSGESHGRVGGGGCVAGRSTGDIPVRPGSPASGRVG
jgi:SAM-dependent methyltransferase